jgi:methylmalonyl-CoA/ethylmalonyl-CoA epimerase
MFLPLHHVGMLVTDIQTEVEKWVSRFGYAVETPIIEDPTQTALVQFLRQPGAQHWLELVAPNGPKSKLSAALRKGAGLHHVCFEADDIEGACRHLREQAMFMISRPVPAVAFGGRGVCWFMDRAGLLVELVGAGDGPLSLASITTFGGDARGGL